jgi:pyruvate/2-oxoglutarate dehydrogenase complex dihydrolipoamide dehydrogenase (E3) component
MMNEFYFDFVIVGGGQAAIPLAYALAGKGKRTLVVERKNLGGSCINFGCTPSKAAIASAKLAHQARRSSEFGIKIPEVVVDFADVIGKASKIASTSREDLEKEIKTSNGISYLHGHASFQGRNEEGHFRLRIRDARDGSQVGTQDGTQDGTIVSCEQVILNCGTRSAVPEIPGLQSIASRVIDADTWLGTHQQYPEKSAPRKIVMLGSGYIGLEMGQFYSRMGSEVVLIEEGPRSARHEDDDVAEALQDSLHQEGMEFICNTQIVEIEPSENGIRVKTLNSITKKESVVEASHFFIATGRTPNTGDLGLETIGLKTSPGGFIPVNEKLNTQVKGVWVAGDIRGGPMFTHTSWDDYRILDSQLLGDGSRTTKRIVPYAMFTDPELGRVGMSEAQAKKAGRNYVVVKFEFAENGKANELRETKGFIKLIADPEKDELLGAAVLGADGAELVQIYVTLMNARAPYSVIRDAIYIHPTLCEAVQSAVAKLPDGKRRNGELGHRVA